ncbi:MAG: TrkA family potassium uptake protein [Clostridia bacterium]
MNILVVGAGHLGRKVAEALDREGHEIVVIAESEEQLAQLSPKFGGVTFQSFPMDIKNLKSAGIESCDAVTVTTSDDNLNITVGQIAKSIFGVENVVSRISDPFREYVFESFGLKSICPTNMSAEAIISAITSPYEQKKVSFGINTITFRIIPADKRHIDKRLSILAGTDEESVFGLITKEGEFKLNTPIQCPKVVLGDNIVFAKRID